MNCSVSDGSLSSAICVQDSQVTHIGKRNMCPRLTGDKVVNAKPTLQKMTNHQDIIKATTEGKHLWQTDYKDLR